MKLPFPYVDLIRAKGRRYAFYRRGGRRIPLALADGRRPDPEQEPGAFAEAWQRIHDSFEDGPQGPLAARPGTVDDLAALFKASSWFTSKAPRTQVDYRRHIDALCAVFGDLPVAAMDTEWVVELHESLAAHPRQADYRIAVLRRMLNFALRRPRRFGLKTNPVQGIERLHGSADVVGFLPWPEEVIEAFEEAAPEPVRRLMVLALNTGQRGQDLVQMAWSHYDGEGIEVAQQKTGAKLWIPTTSAFRADLDTWPRNSPLILTTESGRAWREANMRHRVADTMKKIGAVDPETGRAMFSLHGLRKNATNALYEAGCTPQQVMAVLGWKTVSMAQHYAKGTRQRQMATAAIHNLERHQRRQRRNTK